MESHKAGIQYESSFLAHVAGNAILGQKVKVIRTREAQMQTGSNSS